MEHCRVLKGFICTYAELLRGRDFNADPLCSRLGTAGQARLAFWAGASAPPGRKSVFSWHSSLQPAPALPAVPPPGARGPCGARAAPMAAGGQVPLMAEAGPPLPLRPLLLRLLLPPQVCHRVFGTARRRRRDEGSAAVFASVTGAWRARAWDGPFPTAGAQALLARGKGQQQEEDGGAVCERAWR